MIRVALVALAVSAATTAGAAHAATADVESSAAANRSAVRVRNVTQTEAPPPPVTVAPPPPPADPGGVSAQMRDVLTIVNDERTSRGLVPVVFSEELNEASHAHTRRQADAGSIFHQDPVTGSNPGDRITAAGYRWSAYGENVAAGYDSPRAVMAGWMNSPGHCKNILNPGFTEIGVGFVPDGKTYGEYWTQKFARSASDARPPGTYDPNWC